VEMTLVDGRKYVPPPDAPSFGARGATTEPGVK
jgi:hypothetical protein